MDNWNVPPAILKRLVSRWRAGIIWCWVRTHGGFALEFALNVALGMEIVSQGRENKKAPDTTRRMAKAEARDWDENV